VRLLESWAGCNNFVSSFAAAGYTSHSHFVHVAGVADDITDTSVHTLESQVRHVQRQPSVLSLFLHQLYS